MAYQEIEFYEGPRVDYRNEVEHFKYTFRATGKPGRKSKQPRAFDYLKKSGALRQAVQAVKVEVTRHYLVPGDFMDKLYQQRTDLFRDFDLEGRTLLIGAADYAEMMGGTQFRNSMSFEAGFYKQDSSGTVACGLTVRVIPWMRGLLVMP